MPESLVGLIAQFVAGLATLLWQFVSALLPLLLPLLPGGLWCLWWLLCVNWKRAWPILASGGWLPVALLVFLVTAVWSAVSPTSSHLGPVLIPNFWWQFGCVCALTAVALLCGWLQGQLHTSPEEVNYEPTASHAGGGHGHGHGHH